MWICCALPHYYQESQGTAGAGLQTKKRKRWSNSTGQEASLEDLNRWPFGLGSSFCLKNCPLQNMAYSCPSYILPDPLSYYTTLTFFTLLQDLAPPKKPPEILSMSGDICEDWQRVSTSGMFWSEMPTPSFFTIVAFTYSKILLFNSQFLACSVFLLQIIALALIFLFTSTHLLIHHPLHWATYCHSFIIQCD